MEWDLDTSHFFISHDVAQALKKCREKLVFVAKQFNQLNALIRRRTRRQQHDCRGGGGGGGRGGGGGGSVICSRDL